MINGDDLDAFGYWDMVDAYPPKEKTVLEMVTDYHKTANLDIGTPFSEADYELCNLRWELIEEEYKELMEEVDFVEDILKEMADLVYVLYGAAVTFGWNLDEAVRRVHENNMGRCIQPDGTIKRREDGKVIKNPEYPKVDLSDLV
jgi:hypothetical protein